VEVSTATIGRMLKDLDSKDYTRLMGTAGRVITPKGVEYVSEINERVKRDQLQRKLMNAAQPRNLEELLDLLQARKAIECETARLAAARADREGIALLERSLKKHEEVVRRKGDPTAIALEFHEIVAKLSQNRFLIATLDVLIYEELKLESRISKLITRERGNEYVIQHRMIVDAIKKKNEETAKNLMGVHIDTLIDAIRERADHE